MDKILDYKSTSCLKDTVKWPHYITNILIWEGQMFQFLFNTVYVCKDNRLQCLFKQCDKTELLEAIDPSLSLLPILTPQTVLDPLNIFIGYKKNHI